jgi:hypothetical protein
MHEIAIECSNAVLMARIVDQAGVCIRPWNVKAVTYSLFELRVDGPLLVAGHADVPFNVDDVLFDSLQVGGEWSMDVCGYNFRHEIHVAHPRRHPCRVVRFELVYQLESVEGLKTSIRFQLKGFSR